MKVALVHDYLNQYGGAERVLECLIEMFPDAPIYTLLYDAERTGGRFRGKTIRTSFLDFPFIWRHHRWFLPLMPLAARSLDLGSDFDLIISDTAGYGKGIRYNPRKTRHLSYIHTPLRYAWETGDYVGMRFGRALGKIATGFVYPVARYLKWWDRRVGQRPDLLLANSKFIAEKILAYYGRDARVVYPPVDQDKFFYEGKIAPQDHYLAIGRLLHYKRFDLIIEAFKGLDRKIIIIGSGPEEGKLRRLSSGMANIEFHPFISDESELRKIYASARALIFPHVEDFGLVAAEAAMCGTPIVAYGVGGAKEIVEDGVSGVWFSEPTPLALQKAILRLEGLAFDRRAIAKSAIRFSKEGFIAGFREALKGWNKRF